MTESVRENAILYTVETNRLSTVETVESGRFRHLPIIALKYENNTVGSIDISDWIGELRMNPVKPIPALQLMKLWGAVHSAYVPVSDCIVYTTNSDGEEVILRI